MLPVLALLLVLELVVVTAGVEEVEGVVEVAESPAGLSPDGFFRSPRLLLPRGLLSLLLLALASTSFPPSSTELSVAFDEVC